MKTIIQYQCEICGNRSTSESVARACEARGPGVEIQVGTVFGEAGKRGAFYKDITFVIAKNDCSHHSNSPALWAFRDNNAGDSLGLTDICRGSNETRLSKRDVPDRNHPTFKRAVAFLKKHKIKAYVWTGKESVPL